MRLLGISGSLRAASSNTAVLKSLERLAPNGVTLKLFEGLDTLPHFNPDLDGESMPEPVRSFRATLAAADGLIVSSPEYARGVPGVLKNAFDWLVSGSEFPGKPVMLVNTSPRATHAQASLALTLTTMSGRLVEHAFVTVPLLGTSPDAATIAADPALAVPLTQALRRFVQAISTQ